MKTKLSVFLFSILSATASLSPTKQAQGQNVGIGTTTPNASALLELNSNQQGLLVPRMSMGDRDGIQSPATGLLIYQTDGTPGFYYYDNGWQSMGAASGLMANRTLSNLTGPTAINTDLLPGTSGAYHLGGPSLAWQNIYFSGDVLFQNNRLITVRGTNVFFGNATGNPAITAIYNTGAGSNALSANINGNWNSAFGYEALYNTNLGFSNTGVGLQALFGNTSGKYNTAIGSLTLNSNNSGDGNTAIGLGGLGSATGGYNSALGYFAGSQLHAGDYNTYVGSFADGPANTALTNATALGYQAFVSSSNSVRVGNTSVTSIGGYAGWTNFSDGRFKQSVKENVPGIAFIKQLRAVTYNLDVDAIDKALRPADAQPKAISLAAGTIPAVTADERKWKSRKAGIRYTGFIAQEVEAAAKGLGFAFSGVDAPSTANGFYGLRYAEFTVPLVKAVQELNEKIERLEDSLEIASGTKQNLTAIVQKQQAIIDAQQQEMSSIKAMLLEMQKQLNQLKPSN